MFDISMALVCVIAVSKRLLKSVLRGLRDEDFLRF